MTELTPVKRTNDLGPVGIESETPRSDAFMARVAEPTLSRLRRSTRITFLWFLVPLLIVGIVLAWGLLRTGDYTAQGALWLASMFTFFLVLPVILLRASKLRDVAQLEIVVKNGRAFRGDASDHALADGNRLIVEWNEDSEPQRAIVEVPFHRRLFDGDVTVLAFAKQDRIGVVLGHEELYPALRMSERMKVRLPPRTPESA